MLEQGQLQHAAQDCVQTAPECLQGWRLYHPSGQPMPVIHHSHSKKKVSWCSGKTLCFSLYAVPLVLSLGTTEKRVPSVSFAPSLQVFTYTDEMPPEPSLLQAEQPHLFQPFLPGEILQPLHHLSGPSLDSLQYTAPYLSCTGEPRTEHSTHQGRMTSLSLLATLLLMQPSLPWVVFAAQARCWLMFNLLPTWTPKAFSARISLGGQYPRSFTSMLLLLPSRQILLTESSNQKEGRKNGMLPQLKGKNGKPPQIRTEGHLLLKYTEWEEYVS